MRVDCRALPHHLHAITGTTFNFTESTYGNSASFTMVNSLAEVVRPNQYFYDSNTKLLYALCCY